MSNRSGRQEDEGGLGERQIPTNFARLQSGCLVAYLPTAESHAAQNIPTRSLGIFLRYTACLQKYIPGLEPVEALFSNRLYCLYRDELELICEAR